MTPHEEDAHETQPAPVAEPTTPETLIVLTPQEHFERAMRRRFPTFVRVVSFGSETRAAMKAERAALRRQARRERAAKGKRTR